MTASADERCAAKNDISGLTLNFEEQVISVVRLFRISGESAVRAVRRRVNSGQGLTLQCHELGVDVLQEAVRRWRREKSECENAKPHNKDPNAARCAPLQAETAAAPILLDNSNNAAPLCASRQAEPAAAPIKPARQHSTVSPPSANSGLASLASRDDQVASVMRLLRIHKGAASEIQRRIDSQEPLNIQGVILEISVLREALQVWSVNGGSITQKPHGAVTREVKEDSDPVSSTLNTMEPRGSAGKRPSSERDSDPWPPFASVLESQRSPGGGCAAFSSAQDKLAAVSGSCKNSSKPSEDLFTEGNQIASVMRLLRIHGEGAAQEIERLVAADQPVCVQGIKIRSAVLQNALIRWRVGTSRQGRR